MQKIRKSNGGKYENFWDWLTDDRAGYIGPVEQQGGSNKSFYCILTYSYVRGYIL